mmetsp:Transcript_61929/g.178271  ORF Transcript_61929/g.178271 Transcript_61929/m.178271 type:complete len:236 (-) Transcript_61929:707-1414(-)
MLRLIVEATGAQSFVESAHRYGPHVFLGAGDRGGEEVEGPQAEIGIDDQGRLGEEQGSGSAGTHKHRLLVVRLGQREHCAGGAHRLGGLHASRPPIVPQGRGEELERLSAHVVRYALVHQSGGGASAHGFLFVETHRYRQRDDGLRPLRAGCVGGDDLAEGIGGDFPVHGVVGVPQGMMNNGDYHRLGRVRRARCHRNSAQGLNYRPLAVLARPHQRCDGPLAERVHAPYGRQPA